MSVLTDIHPALSSLASASQIIDVLLHLFFLLTSNLQISCCFKIFLDGILELMSHECSSPVLSVILGGNMG